MNENISNKLYNLESFQKQYKELLKYSVLMQFGVFKSNLHDIIDINNLMSIASILSKSLESIHMETALRIAQTILNYEFSNSSQKEASIVILNNLSNNRTIKLALDKNLIKKNYIDEFPSILQLKMINNNLNNSILVNNKVVSLNNFQSEVFNKVEENQIVSISSPTSSGKSFILLQILLNQVTKNDGIIIYLVPTRALINQVENDIRQLLKKEGLENIYLSTVPKLSEESVEKSIYVLTQERLHWFLVNETFNIKFLIVDEAQQIEHAHRGILVEEKLVEIIEKNDAVKMVFASPFTKNPEVLFNKLPNISEKKSEVVNKDYIAVNQNLLFVSSETGSTKKWNIKLISNIGEIKLPNFEFDESIQEAKRLVKVIDKLSNREGGNLIYQYKPADTEKEALRLYNITTEKKVVNNQKIEELIKLIKDSIHPNYNLATVLEKRIAFHYGNMPLLIRQEVEKLFEEGEIRYIFCTSTLLEGVNLPAKNIFIRKPKRASKIEMSQTDFWNLAGRAGRLGKEFQGNIICIDVHLWHERPSLTNKKNEIIKATTIINNNFDEFIDYIDRKTPRNELENKMAFEYAFNYYYSRWLDSKLNLLLDDSNKVRLLDDSFKIVKEQITIPDYFIKKHVGISPYAQQALYDLFNSKRNHKKFIPFDIHSGEAVESFKNLVVVINDYLSGGYNGIDNGLAYHHATLIVRWIRGYKLSFIITKSIQYWKTRKPNKKRDSIIREVMSDIEEFARFKFAKYSSCYMDILQLVLKEKNKEHLLENIPDLTMWLEFGVSEKTQLSFIELGLSRNTAILLSEYSPRSDMSRNECKEWIKVQDLESFQFSNILINEIKDKIE
ncbi:DEAD/DEAH box helicase [Aliarcobacter skirrowii]|uniref:DEAD/DEAH box helicase n=1 Tax=Aliarcobacter skirrowii TaxID=28200 RepID=UPI0029B3A4CD|nr:DEAD/DEAH box helicase [Aliarcobacter skirrowii]MDX4036248.1 DEAD/DEAH box helicase [Aliarcobacter skirrowii]